MTFRPVAYGSTKTVWYKIARVYTCSGIGHNTSCVPRLIGDMVDQSYEVEYVSVGETFNP